jgi:transposase, IS30 family
VITKRRYRRLSNEARREIYRLWFAGLSRSEIAGRVGQAASTVSYVVAPIGGVRESWVLRQRGAYRLSLSDRIEIYAGLRENHSLSEIAARIAKNVSAVSREIGGLKNRHLYLPEVAHRAALERARRAKPIKLAWDGGGRLADQVIAWLRELWSPEEIANRLVREFPDDEEMRVSPETIYKSIYVQGRGELRRELARCLRSGRAQRQPRTRMERRGRIPGMVSISERPAEIEDRAVPGHWEGDLILGANNRSAIGVLVERATRFVILFGLRDGHGAVQVREAMATAVAQLPAALKRSITWDQGREMFEHRQFAIDTGIDIYFCDPHSPWQRGSNENTNGLLRQYFPKSIDLNKFDDYAIAAAADSLNGRPRKTLGWDTPAEALTKVLALTS